MRLKVNLNSRILSPEHGIYLARPGKGSRLFDFFTERRVIGPELPGVKIARDFPVSDQPDLLAMLRRAKSIKFKQPDESLPALELEAYSDETILRSRSAAQLQSILEGYFERAQQGDLGCEPNSMS